VIAVQFILLAVVHATGSEGLSGLDVATSPRLCTLAATEEGECGDDDISESHNSDGSDEPDNETLVLAVFTFAEVEVTRHTRVGRSIVGRIGVWDILLKLLGGLTGAVDATAFGTLFEGKGDVIRDLQNQRVR